MELIEPYTPASFTPFINQKPPFLDTCWGVNIGTAICCANIFAIENTANQNARNPLHILRYATGSIPRDTIEEPATGQNFHSEKITVDN